MPDDEFSLFFECTDEYGFCEECSHELHWIAWRGGYCCTNFNCDATDINLFNDELEDLED